MYQGLSRDLSKFFALVVVCLTFSTGMFVKPIYGNETQKKTPLSEIGVTVRASTLGFGVEAATPLVRNLNGRLGFNTFGVGFEGTTEDIEYDFDLKLRSLSALADWLPFGSVLRLSGGFLLNGNKLESTALPAGSYTINGTRYSASEVGSVTGKIGFSSPAPYLGIGFGNAVGKHRLGVVFDLGVVLQGSPTVDLTANGSIAQDPRLQADLNQEAQEVENELEPFKIYPVISFGISYKF